MISYTLQDALRLSNIGFKGTSNSERISCPFCSKKKINKNMGITYSSEKFHCFSCGVSGRGATEFYALLHNLTNKEAFAELNSSLGIENVSEVHSSRPAPVIEAPIPQAKEVDDDIKNITYQNMLELMPLSDKHKMDLLDRGFLESEIIGYGTYPAMKEEGITEEYFNIPKKLLSRGCTLEGVPGLYKTKNKQVWTLPNRKSCIMVPYRSFYNQIVCIQLRKNNEDLFRNEETGEVENKYSWLSSFGKNQGCKVSTRIHFACDFAWHADEKLFKPLIKNHRILLTEGAMKADLAHSISGFPFIAVPGVSSALASLAENIPLLKSIGVDTIVMAYDMDKLININVLTVLKQMKALIEENGMKVEEIYWSYKVMEMNKELSTIAVNSSFVFTPVTLQSAIDSENTDDIIEKAISMNRKQIVFALASSKDVSAKNKELYHYLISVCKKHKVAVKCVFWSLKLKGIDDYYAYKDRNVEYI